MLDNEKIEVTNIVSVSDFLQLRQLVGFQALSVEQANKAIKNSSFLISVKYEGRTIGIARVLTDFCTDAYITDVIVDPDYHRNGVGGLLIEGIKIHLKENAVPNVKIACSLYANKGKERFYSSFGFEELPNDKYGYGMLLEL